MTSNKPFVVVIGPREDANEHPEAISTAKVDAKKSSQALEADFVHLRCQRVWFYGVHVLKPPGERTMEIIRHSLVRSIENWASLTWPRQGRHSYPPRLLVTQMVVRVRVNTGGGVGKWQP